MNNRVLIIGGGISGLAAAYYLNKAGFRPAIVEKSQSPGGVIRTERIQGCVIETGPDSFLAAKPWALELIREVGLAAEVINSNDHLRVTYVLRNGKLVPLPDGLMMMVPTKVMPLIATPLLGWGTKLRMGLELLRGPGAPHPDRSVEDFILDHFGQEALDYLTEPLLSGVFGGDPKELSVNSVLTRFVEIEAKYGSLSRGVLAAPKPPGGGSGGSLFRTLKGGLGQLVEHLAPTADWIRGEAETMEPEGSGYRVRVNGAWLRAEQLLIAAPAYVAGRLLQPLDGTLAGLLNGIPYNSSVTLALGYEKQGFDHPLKGFGFLVPKRERKLLKACTWVNNKFDFRAADDKILLRCFFGGDALALSDEELAHSTVEELRTIMGLQAKPVFAHVARWKDSMAQYVVGHGKRLEEISARLEKIPNLALAGNGFRGIGVPDCIHSGKQAAQAIAAAFHRSAQSSSSASLSK